MLCDGKSNDKLIINFRLSNAWINKWLHENIASNKNKLKLHFQMHIEFLFPLKKIIIIIMNWAYDKHKLMHLKWNTT